MLLVMLLAPLARRQGSEILPSQNPPLVTEAGEPRHDPRLDGPVEVHQYEIGHVEEEECEGFVPSIKRINTFYILI